MYARGADRLRGNAVLALLQAPARAQRPRGEEVARLLGAVVARRRSRRRRRRPRRASLCVEALAEHAARRPRRRRRAGAASARTRRRASRWAAPAGRASRTTPLHARRGWRGRSGRATTSASSRRPWPPGLERTPSRRFPRSASELTGPGGASSPCTRAAALTRSSTGRPCTVVTSNAAWAASWRCSEPRTTPSCPAVSPSTRSYHVTRPPGSIRRPITAPNSAPSDAVRPGPQPDRRRELAVRAALLVGRVRRRRVGAAGQDPAQLAGQRLRARPAAHEAGRGRDGRGTPTSAPT